MPEQLIVSTRNEHKLAEIRALLAPWEIAGLEALPRLGEVEETGDTFLANATLKALAASELTDRWILADDSGLEVEALGGKPGVRSARYADRSGHPQASQDRLNNEKLLRELEGETDRRARFRCLMVVARHGKITGTFSGEVAGTIATEQRGTEGFGYDPVFQPEGHDETFAELGSDFKNTLGHRARALAKLKNFLFQQEPSLKG